LAVLVAVVSIGMAATQAASAMARRWENNIAIGVV
jgi:hypothetical protein